MLEALHKSEERFSLAMRGANDGLWDWDVRTGEVYYSPRWTGMLGYGEDEIEPAFSAWDRLVHPGRRADRHGVGIGRSELCHKVRGRLDQRAWLRTAGLPVLDIFSLARLPWFNAGAVDLLLLVALLLFHWAAPAPVGSQFNFMEGTTRSRSF